MIEWQKWHKKVHNNNITFKNNFLSTFLKLSRKFIPLFASDGVCRAVFQRIYHQSITIIMTTTASPPSPSPKHNQHHSIFFQLLHSPLTTHVSWFLMSLLALEKWISSTIRFSELHGFLFLSQRMHLKWKRWEKIWINILKNPNLSNHFAHLLYWCFKYKGWCLKG